MVLFTTCTCVRFLNSRMTLTCFKHCMCCVCKSFAFCLQAMNSNYKQRLSNLSNLALVKFTQDTMVQPRESEVCSALLLSVLWVPWGVCFVMISSPGCGSTGFLLHMFHFVICSRSENFFFMDWLSHVICIRMCVWLCMCVTVCVCVIVLSVLYSGGAECCRSTTLCCNEAWMDNKILFTLASGCMYLWNNLGSLSRLFLNWK